MDYDRDTVTAAMLTPLERICGDAAFTPEAVGRQSKAAMSLCMWVHAMATYTRVADAAAPLRAQLSDAQESLDAAEAQLRAKRRELQVRPETTSSLCRLLLDSPPLRSRC